MNARQEPRHFHEVEDYKMHRRLLLYMAIVTFGISYLAACATPADPSAERIVFIAKNNSLFSENRLYTMNLDGRGPDQVRLSGFEQISKLPAWSPDGKSAVAYSDQNGTPGLYISDNDAKTPRLILGGDEMPDNVDLNDSSDPILSPDGSKLAFLGFGKFGAEIYTVSIDGTSVTRITQNEFSETELSWSPDRKRIVFTSELKVSGGYPTNNLFVINVDKSDVEQLTDDSSAKHDAAWSPDGKRIAFSRKRDIYVLDLDTMDETRLTSDGLNMHPVWSPTGDQIAFISLRDSECDGITIADGIQFCTTAIYLMSANGSSSVLLLKSDQKITDIAWLPSAGSPNPP